MQGAVEKTRVHVGSTEAGRKGTEDSSRPMALNMRGPLTFYEDLCNRQLYRSSLHSLLTNCSGGGDVRTLPHSSSSRSTTTPNTPEWPRRLRGDRSAATLGARWSQQHLAVGTLLSPLLAESTASDEGICASANCEAASNKQSQLYAAATSASADGCPGSRRRAAMHRRARSMDESATSHRRPSPQAPAAEAKPAQTAGSQAASTAALDIAVDDCPMTAPQPLAKPLPTSSASSTLKQCRPPVVAEKPMLRKSVSSSGEEAVLHDSSSTSQARRVSGLLSSAASESCSVLPHSGHSSVALNASCPKHHANGPRSSAATVSPLHTALVDKSNYIVTPFHVRSSSGIVEGSSRVSGVTAAAKGFVGESRQAAKSLEDLHDAGVSSVAQSLASIVLQQHHGNAAAVRTGASASASKLASSCATSVLPVCSTGQAAEARHAPPDNVYENVFRNGLPLVEPVIYANVGSHLWMKPKARTDVQACCVPLDSSGTLPVSHGGPSSATQSSSGSLGELAFQDIRTGGQCDQLTSPVSSASGSSNYIRMSSSCNVSDSSISTIDRDQPGNSSTPSTAATSESEEPTAAGPDVPLYVNVLDCRPPPPCFAGASPAGRSPSPLPEVNYAELLHTAQPTQIGSVAAKKRLSPCLPPQHRSGKRDSGEGVLYAEINIAATEAAHKAQLHQTKYRQEQRNVLSGT